VASFRVESSSARTRGVPQGIDMAGQCLMFDDCDLNDELTVAASRATAAHRRLQATPSTAGNYQQVLNAYLEATILYMSIVCVCHARQHQSLMEEISDLRAEIDHLRPHLHPVH
jgi:hypothetical protein